MGRIAALLPSHGRPVRICTRSSYMMIDKHVTLHGWKGRVTWTTEAVSELSFFVQRGEEFDGSPLPQHFKDLAIRPSDVFVSDASNVKAAVKWLEGSQEGTVATFSFNAAESLSSSGERELFAMHNLFRVANFQMHTYCG